MKSISLFRILTAVLVFVCGAIQVVNAQQTAPENAAQTADRSCGPRSERATKTPEEQKAYDACRKGVIDEIRNSQGGVDQNEANQRADQLALQARCESAKSARNTAMKAASTSCSKLGFGEMSGKKGGSCMDRVSDCQDEAENEGIDFQSIAGDDERMALGAGLLSSLVDQGNGKCSSLTASEYRTEASSIEQRLRELPKDIREEKKKLIDSEKDTKEKFEEINASIQEIDEQKKTEENEAANAEIERANAKLEAKLKLEQEITAINEDIAQIMESTAELLQQAADQRRPQVLKMAQLGCAMAVKEKIKATKLAEREERLKQGKSAQQISTSLGARIRAGGASKTSRAQEYSACIDRFEQDRAKAIRAINTNIRSNDRRLAIAQKRLQDTERLSSQAQANMLNEQTNNDTAKANAEKSYLAKRGNAVQKLANLNDTYQKEQVAINESIKELRKEMSTEAGNLRALGPKPKTGYNKTYTDLAGEYEAFDQADDEYKSACCISGIRASDKNYCDSTGSSTSAPAPNQPAAR